VAFIDYEHTIRVLNTSTGIDKCPPFTSSRVSNLLLSADGNMVIFDEKIGEEEAVFTKVIGRSWGEEAAKRKIIDAGPFFGHILGRGLALSGNSTVLVCVERDKVIFFSVDGSRKYAPLLLSKDDSFNYVCLDDEGSTLVLGGEEVVKIFKCVKVKEESDFFEYILESKLQLSVDSDSDIFISDMDLSGDGRTLVTTGKQGLHVWDLETRECLNLRQYVYPTYFRICFRGDYLAFSAHDSVRLWERREGKWELIWSGGAAYPLVFEGAHLEENKTLGPYKELIEEIRRENLGQETLDDNDSRECARLSESDGEESDENKLCVESGVDTVGDAIEPIAETDSYEVAVVTETLEVTHPNAFGEVIPRSSRFDSEERSGDEALVVGDTDQLPSGPWLTTM